MGRRLHILIVEDSKEDADLLLLELRREGYDPISERVDSAESMSAALDKGGWDIVISDYVMPGFGGMEALELFHAKGLDVPFIVVSGHIGEDLAVAAMRAGADDYLMKDRLGRLGPAIERALQEAETRRAHQRASEALRENEERFRQLAENIGAVFFMFERPSEKSPGSLSYVSQAYQKIWGYPRETLFWNPDLWLNAVHPEDRQRVRESLPQMAQGNFSEEFRILRMDLKTCWIHYQTFPVRNEDGQVYRLAAIAEDITERKRIEEQLSANARQLKNSLQELRLADEELRNRNCELSQARQELETRVQERTADLTVANSELQSQMQQRRRLETELLEIAENERRRIGFDLHDDIGQKLMAVSLLLKALEKNLDQKRLPAANDTRKVQALIDQVINHTHDLAHCFSALDLQGEDLCALMRKLVANVHRTFRIACRFRLVGSLPALSSEVTLQLYKLAQESVSNAIKHGKARKVFISLSRQGGQLVLRIKNDGLPFSINLEPNRRMGLRIMDYRARTMGGVFDIRPNGQSGALVTCKLPFTTIQNNFGESPVTEVVPVVKGRNGSTPPAGSTSSKLNLGALQALPAPTPLSLPLPRRR